MRLFFYYVFHTAKNSLKKLFKTWVLVFLVICLAGGLLVGAIIGGIASKVIPDDLKESMEEGTPPGQSSEDPGNPAGQNTDDPGSQNPDDPDSEIIVDVSVPDEVPVMDLLELAAGMILLLSFTFAVFTAEKSAADIFQPGDAMLLFPSPMKPQSVLLFRTSTQIGASIFFVLYMALFQLPNLIKNTEISGVMIIAIFSGIILMTACSQLLKMLCFVAASTHPRLKGNLRTISTVVMLGITGAFILFHQQKGLGWWDSVVAFFNAPATRFIPFWGWIKGFVVFTAANQAGPALCFLAATLVSGALLAWIIWHMKADFYEEALQKTNEKARLLEAAESADSGPAIIQRKKDRSEKLRRNHFDRGEGANVFFWKSIYNRFRFAHLGFLTKTLDFYLAVVLGVAALCHFVFKTNSPLPMVIVLMFFSFYRSLGNALREDTQMWYFHMIPESGWLKLLYSLAGDLANCFLDILLPLLAGSLLLGAPVLKTLLWIPAILSMTAYATSVGAFIDLSVNVNAGKILKQMIQVIFLYFGLLPDLLIGGLLYFLGLPFLALLLVTIVNFALAALFVYLASLFIGRK